MTQETSSARGAWGEDFVAQHLEAAGHCVLHRRFRSRFGEIDLITQIGEYLCFVEVKLRKDDSILPARAYVTLSKQRKLRLTAEIFLAQNPSALQPRFDVAELYAAQGKRTQQPKLIYWENAF